MEKDARTADARRSTTEDYTHRIALLRNAIHIADEFGEDEGAAYVLKHGGMFDDGLDLLRASLRGMARLRHHADGHRLVEMRRVLAVLQREAGVTLPVDPS